MFFRMGRESIVEQNGAAVYSAYPKDDVGDASLNQSYLYSLSHTFSTNLFGSLKSSFTRFNNANSYDTSLTYTPNLMYVSRSTLLPAGRFRCRDWKLLVARQRRPALRRPAEHHPD